MTKKIKTVLIVEDSPAQAIALRQLLEQEKLQVLWAPDGRTGLTMAQQHQPDVIVLDVEMPEMDGFETCRCLKQDTQTADIPIVILTVHNGTTAAMKGIDLGAIDFIPKGAFSAAVLLETFRQLGILDGTEATEDVYAKD